MATMAFNRYFRENVFESAVIAAVEAHANAMKKGAMFDARCFNIPKEEVANLIYWRQLDATRNSIQMVVQANFSHNELQNKSCNDVQNMLLTQKNINWNDLPTYQKRGSCCVKRKLKINQLDIMVKSELLNGEQNGLLIQKFQSSRAKVENILIN